MGPLNIYLTALARTEDSMKEFSATASEVEDTNHKLKDHHTRDSKGDSSHLLTGSTMTRPDDSRLLFNRPGLDDFELRCVKGAAGATSGAIFPPGGLERKTTTSGYIEDFPRRFGRPYEQLKNESDDEYVWPMCSELDYYLAPTPSRDEGCHGRHLTCHVEKRLLGYLYANLSEIQDVEGRKAIMFVDRESCFDCLFFTAFFEVYTNVAVEIYFNRKEYVAPRRHALRFARNLLLTARTALPMVKEVLS